MSVSARVWCAHTGVKRPRLCARPQETGVLQRPGGHAFMRNTATDSDDEAYLTDLCVQNGTALTVLEKATRRFR